MVVSFGRWFGGVAGGGILVRVDMACVSCVRVDGRYNNTIDGIIILHSHIINYFGLVRIEKIVFWPKTRIDYKNISGRRTSPPPRIMDAPCPPCAEAAAGAAAQKQPAEALQLLQASQS
jgi:hypothetical protein